MLRRIVTYLAGLLVLAFGVGFSVNSDLGVSPVSSLPYTASLILPWGLGLMTAAIFLVFVVLQIIILGKKFKWPKLIQIAFVSIFGFFADFALWVLGDFQIPTYWGRLLMLVISIVLIAVGLVLILAGRFVSLPPEEFCVTLEQRWPKIKFHRAKMVMDCVLVLISLALSLVFLEGFGGVREGTIISAYSIGKIIPFVKKAIGRFLPA